MSTTSEKTTDQLALINVLGSALCDAVDHLDYIGWGDEWERESRENFEPAIREAVSRYKALFPDETSKPEETWVCSKCGREFKSRTSLRQHRAYSKKCGKTQLD